MAALAFCFSFSAEAIEVAGSHGQVQERGSVKGRISQVDNRSITIHWMVSAQWKMRSHSYSQSYQLTPTTEYRGCSLASLKKGTKVLITGHGRTAEVIEIAL